ncbi:polysaccharide lyase [Spirosoma koreense]
MYLSNLLLITFYKLLKAPNAYLTFSHKRFHAAVLSILLSSVLSLSSCTQADTIAPEKISQAAVREDASILYSDDFEGNKMASFWYAELWTPTSGVLTSENKRAGRKSFRISWLASMVDGTNKMMHAELGTKPLVEGETERWYGYSSYLPASSMANDDQIAIISQWHAVPDEGQEHTVPPLRIEVQSNRLRLAYTASNKPILKLAQAPTTDKKIDLGPALFDQWVDYVVHVKWSPTGEAGQVQVWQNGILVVNEQNINIGYPEKLNPYWKCGLYCWMGKDTYPEKVVYYDEVRIGGATAGYDAVKPGRSDGTAKVQQYPKN